MKTDTFKNGTCPRCGRSLADDVIGRLCPACVLEAATAGESGSQEANLSETIKDAPLRPPRQVEEAADWNHGEEVHYFGDYKIVHKIAQGGMGVVYKAVQKSLNRTVAIKMIRTGGFASETEVNRFLAEAEAAANLQHPNIVAIHEVGNHRGQHYFSMDYVEGMNLADKVKESPLAAAEAARLVLTLAEAIQYAHQRGILHRDLKPQNVLLDADGIPRITDFGLAKRIGQESGLTMTGAVIGTPSYMAPEQASSKSEEFGPPGDVHALGAILYFLLTGRPPFSGATTMETILQVLSDAPRPPREITGSIPPDLNQIVLKCLEKKPERRYATARLLAEDLQRFINHEPVTARSASALARAWVWVQKHPWMVTGFVSFLLVAMGFLSYGLWEFQRVKLWEAAHPGDVHLVGYSPTLICGGTVAFLVSWLTSVLTVRFSKAYRQYRRTGIPVSRMLTRACAVCAITSLVVVLTCFGALLHFLLWFSAGYSSSVINPLLFCGFAAGFYIVMFVASPLKLLWRLGGSTDLSRFTDLLQHKLEQEEWIGQFYRELEKRRGRWMSVLLIEISLGLFAVAIYAVGATAKQYAPLLQVRPETSWFTAVFLPLLNSLLVALVMLASHSARKGKTRLLLLAGFASIEVLMIVIATRGGSWSHEGRLLIYPALAVAAFSAFILILIELSKREAVAKREVIDSLPEPARRFFTENDWSAAAFLNVPSADAPSHGRMQALISTAIGVAVVAFLVLVSISCLHSSNRLFGTQSGAVQRDAFLVSNSHTAVPAADNFGGIRVMAELLGTNSVDTNLITRIRKCATMADRYSWAFAGGMPRSLSLQGGVTNSALQTGRTEQARTVRARLETLQPEFSELLQGAGRYYAVAPPIRMREGVLVEPSTVQKSAIQDLSSLLALHCSASLELRDFNAAITALRSLRCMAELLSGFPSLDCFLLRTKVLLNCLQAYWEISHSRPDLIDRDEKWEQWLESNLVLEDFRAALTRWEPAWAARRMEAETFRSQAFPYMPFADPPTVCFAWVFLDRRINDEIYAAELGRLLDPSRGIASPVAIEGWIRRMEACTGAHAHRNLFKILYEQCVDIFQQRQNELPQRGVVQKCLPVLKLDHATVFRCQSLLQLCRVASALRRHANEVGSLPDQLARLSPHYLKSIPKDPMSGTDFQYRRIGSRNFELYSVGWDGKDDAGKPASEGRLKDAGDWPWTAPADASAN